MGEEPTSDGAHSALQQTADIRVSRGTRWKSRKGSDSEFLLVAVAAKGLPPVVYPQAYDSPLEINDSPVVSSGQLDAALDSSETRTTPTNCSLRGRGQTRPDSAPSENSEASVSRINVLPALKNTTTWQARVSPLERDPSRNSPEPIHSPTGTASLLPTSTGSMPRSDGGLDREDTVEMKEYRRQQQDQKGNGDATERPKYIPSWPSPEEVEDAEGVGRGLPSSDSTEDLSNLISIHQAARDGTIDIMRRYLEQIGSHKHKRVNKLDENNLSALHYAARYNHLEIVKLLIKHQADGQCMGEDNTTPMHHAARCKRTTMKTSPTGLEDDDNDDDDDDLVDGVITFLESQGADVNVEDIYGQTPLHFAAMRGNDVAAKELLSSPKILHEAVDKQLMTPLHMACTHGNLLIAKMLIDKKAMLRCKDEEGNTPLLVACTEGHVEIVKLLFEAGEEQRCLGQMLTDTDYEDNSPLHVAVDSGKQEIVQMCLEKGAKLNSYDKQRNTPLHIAAAAGHIDIVKLLLSKSANVDALNIERATPLHRASAFNRHQVVEYLQKSGARIERREKDNFTPLLIAASNGHSATIAVLLKNGANIRAVDKHEKSSIYWAAQENEVQALTVLLDHRKHKAKKLLMASDRYNNTPLHIAAEKGYINIVKILLDRGATLEAKNEEEQTALHLAAAHGRVHTLKELVRRDLTGINDEDENSNTPLHLAASEGHAKCVLALIEAGADIEARNQSLWTPLDCSAANGWVKCATALLENDSPIDPVDKTRTTPLHLASKNGHVDMVKLLCERGADLSLKDGNNHSCMDLAIDNGHQQVARVIISHKHWQHAMYSVSKDKFTKIRSTPMRKLIKKMPDVAEVVFNRCVSQNEFPPEHKKYCITFDYELLDDMFSKWDDNSADNVSEISGNSNENGPFMENGKLFSHASTYTSSSKVLRLNHPLTIMVNSKRDELLGHPLVTSLMQHKWDSYGRFFYYTSLVFYALFLVFLTGYVVTNPPEFYYNVNFTTRTFEWRVAEGKQRWEQGFSSATHFLFGNVGHWVIIVLSAVNILKELVQLYHQKLNYFGWVNVLEWAIYVSSILFVIPWSGVYYPYGTGDSDCTEALGSNCIMLRMPWQWQLGAVAVFLAWINLILFLRKFPQFGIYIVMFTDVLKTFLQFAIVFFLFIIAFGLAFYSLLQNQQSFHRVHYALVKTFVMMIGEFEFDSIFHNLNYLGYGQDAMENEELFLAEVFYNGVTYAVFVIFVIIMSIIIMNLLVGLAVDDIKEVQEQAKLKRLGMQVNLAMEVQEALPSFLWRRSIKKTISVHPNQQSRTMLAKFYHWYSGREELLSDTIMTALNPPKTELEEIKDQQDELASTLKNVKYRLKMMRAQNDRIEGMMEALLKKTDVDFEEGEASEEVGE